MADLDFDAYEVIRSEGDRILELGRRDLDRPVPQYPGWDMRALLSHTGAILGRTSSICRDLLTERPESPRPEEGEDVADWFGHRLGEAIDSLRSADHDAPVWGFGPDPVVGFWLTRMVVEVGMHRWDADQAFGDPEPLRDEVAATGLDEFSDMWHPRLEGVQPLLLVASDLGRQWKFGDGDPAETVEATASDLYLRLMSRPSAARLPDDWAAAIDGLAPPPR